MSEEQAIEVAQPGQLARQEVLGIDVGLLMDRLKKIRQVRDDAMQDGVHYGKIPGVKKPTLLKPGAETLCMVFGLYPTFRLEKVRDGEHLEVNVTCTLHSQGSGAERGDGVGFCSTRESKYAWRTAGRECPQCGSTTALMKSKHDPEWFCWAKKDGCGETFALDDPRITKQVVGRVPNPDIADLYNTVIKMACKRAHVAATLFVTGASEHFTQDVEDMAGDAGDAIGHPDGKGDVAPPRNDRSRSGNGQRQQPKKPPTKKELDSLLAAIGKVTSVEEIAELGKRNTGRGWTQDQKSKLNEAAKARRNDLAGDFDDAPESDDVPDFAELTTRIQNASSLNELEGLAELSMQGRWSKWQQEAIDDAHDKRRIILEEQSEDPERAAVAAEGGA